MERNATSKRIIRYSNLMTFSIFLILERITAFFFAHLPRSWTVNVSDRFIQIFSFMSLENVSKQYLHEILILCFSEAIDEPEW